MKPRARAEKLADRDVSAPVSSAERVRITVQKTWKMYVGGAFVRSESGRTFTVSDPDGTKHNVSKASRKDLRDAVTAATAARAGWSSKTPYLRGQIVYRIAEVMESRAAELIASLERAGASRADATTEAEDAVDRTVAWAGWADKYASLSSNLNPVAGPHFTFTVPEPVGVVALVAPEAPSLLGLVSAVLPIIVSGNAVIALASATDPRTAITLAEVLATSDVPGGVVNVLTGDAAQIAPEMARHREIAALDLWLPDGELATSVETLAADSVKRVRRRSATTTSWRTPACESLGWLERFIEHKTIWHPVGV